VQLFVFDSTNRQSRQRHRCGVGHSQVKRDVVGVALVHHLHTQVGTVDHLSPGGDHLALGIKDLLVGVEAVQVEGHPADAKTLEWPLNERTMDRPQLGQGQGMKYNSLRNDPFRRSGS
jgi:hypothetical protein